MFRPISIKARAIRPLTRRRYERLIVAGSEATLFRRGRVLFWREHRLPYRATVLDLSETGIRLALVDEVRAGERLRVQARLFPGNDLVEGDGVAVWCAADARIAGETLVGLEWVRLPRESAGAIRLLRQATRRLRPTDAGRPY